MDPTEALKLIIEAALDRNPIALRDAAEDLATWLEGGGFAPDFEAVARKLGARK